MNNEFVHLEEDRVIAFKKNWQNSLKRKMLEARLSHLVAQGITDSEEIDSLLDQLSEEKKTLMWSWDLITVE